MRISKLCFMLLIAMLASCGMSTKNSENGVLRTADGAPARTVAIDTMELRDPFVYFDKRENTYYMTGTGGNVWTS